MTLTLATSLAWGVLACAYPTRAPKIVSSDPATNRDLYARYHLVCDVDIWLGTECASRAHPKRNGSLPQLGPIVERYPEAKRQRSKANQLNAFGYLLAAASGACIGYGLAEEQTPVIAGCAAGAVLAFVLDYLGETERGEIADQYNAALREELGLPQHPTPTDEPLPTVNTR